MRGRAKISAHWEKASKKERKKKKKEKGSVLERRGKRVRKEENRS